VEIWLGSPYARIYYKIARVAMDPSLTMVAAARTYVYQKVHEVRRELREVRKLREVMGEVRQLTESLFVMFSRHSHTRLFVRHPAAFIALRHSRIARKCYPHREIPVTVFSARFCPQINAPSRQDMAIKYNAHNALSARHPTPANPHLHVERGRRHNASITRGQGPFTGKEGVFVTTTVIVIEPELCIKNYLSFVAFN
jgi:hypothetical protein